MSAKFPFITTTPQLECSRILQGESVSSRVMLHSALVSCIVSKVLHKYPKIAPESPTGIAFDGLNSKFQNMLQIQFLIKIFFAIIGTPSSHMTIFAKENLNFQMQSARHTIYHVSE